MFQATLSYLDDDETPVTTQAEADRVARVVSGDPAATAEAVDPAHGVWLVPLDPASAAEVEEHGETQGEVEDADGDPVWLDVQGA